MSDEMEQEAVGLLNALDAPVLAEDARVLATVNAMEDLKGEVLGFFKNRIASIARSEHIKDLVFQQLEQDIQGGELSFDQKMTILMRLARDNNDSADSIISMFRPSANGQGSLLTDIVRPGGEKSDLAKAFDNYTPDQLRKVQEFANVLRDLVEGGATVSVDTHDGKIPVAEV